MSDIQVRHTIYKCDLSNWGIPRLSQAAWLSTVSLLSWDLLFEQGALHFYVALNPAVSIADVVCRPQNFIYFGESWGDCASCVLSLLLLSFRKKLKWWDKGFCPSLLLIPALDTLGAWNILSVDLERRIMTPCTRRLYSAAELRKNCPCKQASLNSWLPPFLFDNDEALVAFPPLSQWLLFCRSSFLIFLIFILSLSSSPIFFFFLLLPFFIVASFLPFIFNQSPSFYFQQINKQAK